MSEIPISIRRALGDKKFVVATGKGESPNPRGERKREGVRRTAAAQDKGRDRERGGGGRNVDTGEGHCLRVLKCAVGATWVNVRSPFYSSFFLLLFSVRKLCQEKAEREWILLGVVRCMNYSYRTYQYRTRGVVGTVGWLVYLVGFSLLIFLY